jgi:alanine racemase
VQRWREAGGGLCDLMVDTGINRLGLPLADLGDPALAGLDIDCCISHLASADEDVAQNAQQLERFNACARKCRRGATAWPTAPASRSARRGMPISRGRASRFMAALCAANWPA